MEKFFKLCILSALLCTSCQEGGEAGDLFGQWRMTNTDDKFIAFSGGLTVMRLVDVDNKRGVLAGEVYGKFQHIGDSLFIQCYSINASPSDTIIVENYFGLKPFNDIRLKIDILNDDRLHLNKDGRQWHFYKY